MLGIGPLKQRMVEPAQALAGRSTPMPIVNRHHVHGRPLVEAFDGHQQVRLGMGCFWGAERKFWQLPGVHTTAVGYAGGYTPNPTYEEVCSGMTGHAEVVSVVFDARQLSFDDVLRVFWESHDPTQGMRQGNDAGTQYRSVIHCTTPADYACAIASRDAYQQRLRAAGLGEITTQITHPAPPFYYAEDAHQQYLSKHPGGYCGLRGTGVSCAI